MSRRTSQQYLKIAEYLRQEIRNGNLEPGDFLPSEAELCERFNSSRGPVRQAMSSLRSMGLISSGRGRRSVVLGNFENESFESSFSVHAFYRHHGETPVSKILVLARCPAPAEVATALNLEEGDTIVYLQRVHGVQNINRVIEEQYFPLSIGRHILSFEESDGSLHEYLEKAGIIIDNGERVLQVVPATKEEAEILQIEPETPLWYTKQYLNNHSGEPVEFSKFKYLSNRIEISMSMVRGSQSPLRLSYRQDAT